MKTILLTIVVIIHFSQFIVGQLPESPVAGGVSKTPPEHYQILTPTLLALEREMDNRMNSPYVHRIGKITDANSQIVAGVRYYVTFDFGQTSCLKNVTTAVEKCNNFVKMNNCQADIWVKPWVSQNELLGFQCA